MAWTSEAIPDLSERTLLVTGGNSGLGFETARALARRSAEVVLACRSLEKAAVALDAIRKETPAARLEAMELDLASLDSVRRFSDAFLGRYDALHVLVNNAGVMALPYRTTADGFEMQLGTNHLGHFALTGLLLERLLGTPGSRVVTVSSTAHKVGRMRWGDLRWERGYSRWRAYGQSKLANLLFTYELQRRLEDARAQTLAVACHPGYASTNLQTAGPRMAGSAFGERGMRLINRLFAQSAEMGALPTLYAACADDVVGGEYFGPDGFSETWGHPTRVRSSARSHDRQDQARLWEVSEQLTGVRYDWGSPATA